EPPGELVAVVAVGAGGDAAEPARRGGEITCPAERMLTPRAATEARGEVVEAGLARLLQRVQGARRQAAGCGGVLDRAALVGEAAVRIAWCRGRAGGRDRHPRGRAVAELVERLLDLGLALGRLVGLHLGLVD